MQETTRRPSSSESSLEGLGRGSYFHERDDELIDSLDLNSVANDGHTQFLNWTVVNVGAHGYAAGARGDGAGTITDQKVGYCGHRVNNRHSGSRGSAKKQRDSAVRSGSLRLR
jgi:hypothetical protein